MEQKEANIGLQNYVASNCMDRLCFVSTDNWGHVIGTLAFYGVEAWYIASVPYPAKIPDLRPCTWKEMAPGPICTAFVHPRHPS